MTETIPTAEELFVAKAIYAAFPTWRKVYEPIEPGGWACREKRVDLAWDDKDAQSRHSACIEAARVAISALRQGEADDEH